MDKIKDIILINCSGAVYDGEFAHQVAIYLDVKSRFKINYLEGTTNIKIIKNKLQR